MKEKIKSLKSAIKSIDENNLEVVEALERLENNLPDNPGYPGEASLKKTISETVDEIESTTPPPTTNFLSKKWGGLVDELEKWENDHPGVTLIVGDIARALAISGL